MYTSNPSADPMNYVFFTMDFGQGSDQSVEFNSTMEDLFQEHKFEKGMKITKQEWKSKAEDVSYEEC